jgi:hypothetical protein
LCADILASLSLAIQAKCTEVVGAAAKHFLDLTVTREASRQSGPAQSGFVTVLGPEICLP